MGIGIFTKKKKKDVGGAAFIGFEDELKYRREAKVNASAMRARAAENTAQLAEHESPRERDELRNTTVLHR